MYTKVYSSQIKHVFSKWIHTDILEQRVNLSTEWTITLGAKENKKYAI